MTNQTIHAARKAMALTFVLVLGWAAVAAAAAAPESKRLILAKDYMADEQWTRAVDVLRQAVDDPKESRRDEVLYWLAHSFNESGDRAASLATILRLERDFPASLWVKPARSLRIQIAVRMDRSDVLWWTAVAPAPSAPTPGPSGRRGQLLRVRPRAIPAAPDQKPDEMPQPSATPPPPQPKPSVIDLPAPQPPSPWLPDAYMPDTDLRIQAMTSLIRTDAARVLPMLRDIALEVDDPGEAGRAVFALAQSDRPEAREMVIHIAKMGPEPVRVAAVKQLGRFGGPEISGELLGVYTTSGRPVRWQIVRTLGERADKGALLRIAESEKDPALRDRAIIMLGQAGGDQQLATLYPASGPQGRSVIIIGLFNARSDTQLIRVAEQERDERLRTEAIAKLRLLGSPKAKAYLLKLDEKR